MSKPCVHQQAPQAAPLGVWLPVLAASPGTLQPPGLAPGYGGRAARCLARALPTFARELLLTSGLWAILRVSLSPEPRYLADPNPDLLSQLSWLDLGSSSSLEIWLFLNYTAFLVWLLQDRVLDGESIASGWLATTPSSWAIFPQWNSPLLQSKPFTRVQLFQGSWNRQLREFYSPKRQVH